MISGFLAITIGFVAAIVSMAAFFYYAKDKTEDLYRLGQQAFWVSGIAIVVAFTLLMWAILTHKFQIAYVYQYSSHSLGPGYLFTTFWGGQEGTFLLWLFYGAIYGLILLKTVGKRMPLVMGFHVMVQAYLLLILLEKNPFATIYQVYDNVPVGFIPQDGQGLNPLLQNPWMRVHPPTLFLGYSASMVIFAFAMHALLTRNFHGWLKPARPWIIFFLISLGAGIILGGYWAYVTLGWGGYWAWDPVENASLVPWLIGVVLLHGVIIQSRLKSLVRLNLFLAGFTFITVLWGSFLTRSGVLTDFSVHSFAESGLNAYLIGTLILFGGLFLVMYLREWRRMKAVSPPFSDSLATRETLIFLGMMAIFLTGIFVLFATSAPIYSGLFFDKPISIQPEVYNQVIVPVAVAILILIGLTPVTAWRKNKIDWKAVQKSALIAAAFTGMSYLLGAHHWKALMLIFLSVFTIWINGIFTYRFLLKNYPKAGAYLTHVGLAFMVIGIITSSLFDRHEKVNLPIGEFHDTPFGYQIKFEGFVADPDGMGKDRVKLVVKTPTEQYIALPQFYYSKFTKSYMVSPDVKNGFTRDIYIAPISFIPANSPNVVQKTIPKGDHADVAGMEVYFEDFDVQMSPGKQVIKALLKIKIYEESYWKPLKPIFAPTLIVENGEMRSEPVVIPNNNYKISIEKVNPNEGTVTLNIEMPKLHEKETDILSIELREKPLIVILWFGSFLLIGGLIFTLIDRIQSMANPRRR